MKKRYYILLILIGLFSILFVNNNNKLKIEFLNKKSDDLLQENIDINKNIDNSKNKLISLKNNNKNKEYKEYKKWLEEINIYNNIEESTIKIKEEYFNTISKLEQDIINGSSNKKLLI